VYSKKALIISLKTLSRDHPDVEKIEENIRRMINIRNAQNPTASSKNDSEYILLTSLGMD
jgi:hypothetical protein